MIRISPSILSADFSRLEQEVADVEASGAHMLHIDVMDGHFVPNISFGSCVISSLRPRTKLFFDVHLMISDPRTYALSFAKAGADMITFHYESQANAQQTVDVIRSLGLKVGMAVKPATDISVLEPFLPQLDMALVMTVEPGFGGQKFIPNALYRLSRLAELRARGGHDFRIEVDGGVNAGNARQIAAAGADLLVAGNAVLGAPDPTAAYTALCAAVAGVEAR